MNIQFQQNRVFSRWAIKPELGEPSYGYFARLVAEEGHPSVRIYATEVGLNGRHLEPEKILHSLLDLPLGEDQKEKLKMATPFLDGTFQKIGKEKLRKLHISHSFRRFCPHCLGEKPFHRIWWDVLAFKICPVHGTSIQDRIEGRKIKWWWPHFDHAPNGFEIADRRRVANPPDASAFPFHRMVIQRLSGQGDGSLLAGFELFEIIEASMAMSRVLGSQTYKSMLDPDKADIETGYEFLISKPEDQIQQLIDWLCKWVPKARLKKGYQASCERLRSAFLCPGNRMVGNLDRLLQTAFARIGTLGRKNSVHSDIERSDKTLREASVALNVPSKALSKFTRKMGILKNAKWNGDVLSFDEQAFAKLKLLVDDLTGLPDTKQITKIPGHEFRFLEKAGFIEFHAGMSINGKQGPKYLKSDVEKLVKQVRDMDLPSANDEMISLCSFAKRTGQRPGEALCKILSGELVPDALDLSKAGFRCICFCDPSVSNETTADPNVDELRIDENCPVSLWSFFGRHLKKICPTVRVPDLIPDVGSIRNSNGKFAAAIQRIDGNGGAFTLTVEFHPERTKRRWQVYSLKREQFHAVTEGKWQSTDDGRGKELVLTVMNGGQAMAVAKTVKQLQRILITRV